MFSLSVRTKRQETKKAWQEQNRYVKRGVLTLKDLFHLPLHSLQAPDVLCFALFFCRGKQLRETDRERLVIKREQDLSSVLTALSGPAFIHLILSTAHLNRPANHKGHLVCMVCKRLLLLLCSLACVCVHAPDFWCLPVLSSSSLHLFVNWP